MITTQRLLITAFTTFSLFSSFITHAEQLSVKVKSLQGEAVDAVVYLDAGVKNSNYAGNDVAIMDQIDRQFSPYILAIQQGQPVSFPNSDSIKHHVYSFSPAKVFELELYKEGNVPPLTFEKAGVVELGCNVHDWMLGYIFVAPNPFYARTNDNGEALIQAPKGQYQIKIWHPRLNNADLGQAITVDLTENTQTEITLTAELAPDTSFYGDDVDEFAEYE